MRWRPKNTNAYIGYGMKRYIPVENYQQIQSKQLQITTYRYLFTAADKMESD